MSDVSTQLVAMTAKFNELSELIKQSTVAQTAMLAEVKQDRSIQTSLNTEVLNKLNEVVSKVSASAGKANRKTAATTRSVGAASTGAVATNKIPSNALNFWKALYLEDKAAACAKYGISAEVIATAETDPILVKKNGDIKIKAIANIIWKTMGKDIKDKLSGDRKALAESNAASAQVTQPTDANSADESKDAPVPTVTDA
jgi:hypothetical protein